MTIALSIKVNDGLVLAADSATTMSQGNEIINIYDNANKVFNLHKQLPVGAITWGAGNIGRSSIAALVKNFRKTITEGSLAIDPDSYTVQHIANRFFEYMLDQGVDHAVTNSSLGFLITGYSMNRDFPECWHLSFSGNGHSNPELFQDEEATGGYWDGQPEALNRLIWGFNPNILQPILQSVGIGDDKVEEIMRLCHGIMNSQIITPFMPIQDAIDIAEFMIQTTIKYVKYTPGHQTVGGPIEIAAITKHEGFKWIKRKHYYNSTINPEEV